MLTELPLSPTPCVIQDNFCCKQQKIQPNVLTIGESSFPGRVGYRGLQSTNSVISARAQVLSISLPSHAVPSHLVVVAVRDTSSQRDSNQRTSSLFTSSKGGMFPFVALSLRGNKFFPQNPPLDFSSISESGRIESHDHLKINLPENRVMKLSWTT